MYNDFKVSNILRLSGSFCSMFTLCKLCINYRESKRGDIMSLFSNFKQRNILRLKKKKNFTMFTVSQLPKTARLELVQMSKEPYLKINLRDLLMVL